MERPQKRTPLDRILWVLGGEPLQTTSRQTTGHTRQGDYSNLLCSYDSFIPLNLLSLPVQLHDIGTPIKDNHSNMPHPIEVSFSYTTPDEENEGGISETDSHDSGDSDGGSDGGD
ncbi:MAG: hypothetical protein AABW79_02165 [Nanoarchaeota archaeon]